MLVTILSNQNYTCDSHLQNKAIMDSCKAILPWLDHFPHKVFCATALLVFSPLTLFLNLTLITSFIATKQATKNSANILIIGISVSDLISGAVSMPLTANALLDVDANDICIKSKVLFIFSGNLHFSVVLTVLLAMDRYLHMNPDIQNRQQSSLRKIFMKPNIYLLIVLAIICSIPLFVIAALYINVTLSLAISITFTSCLSLYTFTLACLYTRGYLRIRKSTENNPVYSQSAGSTNAPPEYVRRLYKTVLILVLMAFFRFVPLSVIYVTGLILSSGNFTLNKTIFSYIFEIADMLLTSGCFTNCLVVLYYNGQAKNWILAKIGIRRLGNENV